MKKCVEESTMYLLLQAAKPAIVRSEDVENSVTVGIVLIPVVNALIYRTPKWSWSSSLISERADKYTTNCRVVYDACSRAEK